MIDYVLESKKFPDAIASCVFLKENLLHIENWEKMLKECSIDLSILYDSAINYWCPEQVEDMAKLIAIKYPKSPLADYFTFLVNMCVYIYVI